MKEQYLCAFQNKPYKKIPTIMQVMVKIYYTFPVNIIKNIIAMTTYPLTNTNTQWSS